MACRVVCLAAATAAVAIAVRAAPGMPGAPITGSFTGGAASGTWTVDGERTTLEVHVTWRGAKAWAGFGWHAVGADGSGMYGADYAVLEWAADGTPTVGDFTYDADASSPHAVPVRDTAVGGTDDIAAFGASRDDGNTTMWFRKALNTGDRFDAVVSDGSMAVIWAHPVASPYDEYERLGPDTLPHGASPGVDHGELRVNFFTGAAVTDNLGIELRTAHAMLMFMAYAVFAPFGLFVARFAKDYYWWFPLHIGVMSLKVVTATAALVIAVYMVKGVHFSALHEWFGLLTLCLTVLQPLLGASAHVLWQPDRTHAPVWPDLVHAWSGRAAVALGWVTIVLGLVLFDVPAAAYYGAAMLMLFHVGVHLFVEAYRCCAKGEVLVV